MKIAIASSSIVPIPTWRFTGYGGEITSYYLALELRRMGHEVLVFAPYPSKLPPDIPLGAFRPSYTSICRSCEHEIVVLYQHILRSVDVVHDTTANAVLADYQYKFGRPVLVTRNGYDLSRPMTNKRNIVVLSKAVKKYAKQYLGVETRVVPNGIPVNEYPFCREKKGFVLYTGHPHPSKGLDLIIEVAKKLPNVRFMLAWSPTFYDHFEYHAQYQRMARGLRNVSIITLPNGWDGEQAKRMLMCQASLFLQPTIYLEALGLTAIEAMSTGTAVLLSTAGSGPELVRRDVGLLVRNKLSLREQALEWHKHIMDAIELDELQQLIEESLERKWDYAAIRDYAKSRFDVSVTARNYLQLYEKLMNGKYWGN